MSLDYLEPSCAVLEEAVTCHLMVDQIVNVYVIKDKVNAGIKTYRRSVDITDIFK